MVLTPFFYNSPSNRTGDKIANPNYVPEAIFRGLSGGGPPKDRPSEVGPPEPEFGTPSSWEQLPAAPESDFEPPKTHTNMVPFYGSTIKQSLRGSDQTLDLFTGQFRLNRENKKESAPFFSPVAGLSEVYGNHEHRDLSRSVPSNMGKRNNELPFEQERVASFDRDFRPMPKRTEETVVNPRFESEGRIIKGKARVDHGALPQHISQNRPTVLVENTDGRRNFVTTGAVRARTLRPSVVLLETARKYFRKFFGTPGGALPDAPVPEGMKPRAQESRRQALSSLQPSRNLHGGHRVRPFPGKSERRPNRRAATGSGSQPAGIVAQVKRAISGFFDGARGTNRQDDGPAGILGPVSANGASLRQEGPARQTSREQDLNRPGGPAAKAGTRVRDGQRARETGRQDSGALAMGPATERRQVRAFPGDIARATAPELPGLPGREVKAGARSASRNDDRARPTAPEFPGLPGREVKAGDRSATRNEDRARSTARGAPGAALNRGAVAAGNRARAATSGQARNTGRESLRSAENSRVAVASRGPVRPRDAKTTGRQSIESSARPGALRPEARKAPARSEEPLRTTVRETSENDVRAGNLDVGAGAHRTSARLDEPLRKTARESVEEHARPGALRPETNKAPTRSKEPLRTTARETAEGDVRAGNLRPSVPLASVHPEEQLRKTVRETTENRARAGNLEGGGARARVRFSDQARGTGRSTLRAPELGGVSGGVKSGTRTAGAARKTIRETTERADVHRSARPAHASAPSARNGQQLRTTARETDDSPQLGQFSGHKKLRVYDPDDVARQTSRQEDGKPGLGPVGGSDQRARAREEETAKPTDREAPGDVGAFGNQTMQNGRGYQVTKAEAKNTSRQFLADNGHTGNSAAAIRRPRKYDSAYLATLADKVLVEDRAPTETKSRLFGAAEEPESLSRRTERKNPRSAAPELPKQFAGIGGQFQSRLPLPELQRNGAEVLDALKDNPLVISH
ncbi:MAG: hypothetical protein ACYCOU_04325 [Sulfobacillus sp.]